MKRKALITAALLCFVTVCLAAIADLNGKWTGSLKTPDGNDLQVNYVFKIDGDKLSGTAQGDGQPTPINEGKITGDDITFKITNENGTVIPHSGKYYSNGDSIAMNIDFQGTKLHATLKRAVDK